METGPTFTINGLGVPAVWMRDFRFQDWALIREITGLDKEQFVLAHNEDRDAMPDPLVLYGYAAVSWWHAHPLVTRERISVEASEWTEQGIVLQLPEDADAGPPDTAEDESVSKSSSESSSTSDASNSSADDTSASTTQNVSGQPG